MAVKSLETLKNQRAKEGCTRVCYEKFLFHVFHFQIILYLFICSLITAEIEMRSDVAAGVVTLKGKVSNRYIAMSTTGSLYTTVSVAAG